MNEKVLQVAKHPAAIPTAVGVISAGVGLAVGYVIGMKRGVSRTWDIVEEELTRVAEDVPRPVEVTIDKAPKVVIDADKVEDMRGRWAKDAVAATTVVSERVLSSDEVRDLGLEERRKAEEATSADDEAPVVETYPQAVIDAAAEAGITPEQMARDMKRVQSALEREAVAADEPETVEANIFANHGEGWDLEKEQAARQGQTVYVLHADEYNSGESGYSQQTLTYYAGDELMADEQEEIVPNHDKLVGELKFGHGSGDPSVVFVRNDEREAEYEILLHTGKYTKEVMNLDLPDERTPRQRRMRPDVEET